jgi:hypothetical protein
MRKNVVMRTRLFPVLVLAAAIPLALTGQPKPPSDHCDVSPGAPLALVTGSGRADLWNSYAPSMKFSMPAGQPVAIGKRDGDWTCVSHHGSGYGWMLTNRLQPIQPDLHPPVIAWTGAWTPLGLKKQPREAVTRLVISTSSAPGNLKVDGHAYWFGAVVNGERVTHEGAVEGEAQPNENRLHIAEGSCEVNFSLIGGFLVVQDNRECGGMNVTFTGVWQKTN